MAMSLSVTTRERDHSGVVLPFVERPRARCVEVGGNPLPGVFTLGRRFYKGTATSGFWPFLRGVLENASSVVQATFYGRLETRSTQDLRGERRAIEAEVAFITKLH